MSSVPRIYTEDFKKIKEEIQRLKRLKWYQRWWGILILGFIASTIVSVIFYFL